MEYDPPKTSNNPRDQLIGSTKYRPVNAIYHHRMCDLCFDFVVIFFTLKLFNAKLSPQYDSTGGTFIVY